MTPPPPATPGPTTLRLGRLAALRAWAPSGAQLTFVAIGLLAVANVALWAKLERAEKSRAVTVVAVREMTQSYLTKIASGNLSPQEAAVRAQMFVSVAQDEIKHLVPDGRSLVLARECVLAGDQNDITASLQAATERKLGTITSGLSNVVGPVAAAPFPVLPVATTPAAPAPTFGSIGARP